MSNFISNTLASTLVAGALSFGAKVVYLGQKGIDWQQIGQKIYSSVIGAPALEGGMNAALMGIGVHFGVVLVMAVVLGLLMSVISMLKSIWPVTGIAYGLLLYCVMTYHVMPMTKMVDQAKLVWPPVVNEALYFSLFYYVLIGLVVAFFFKAMPKRRAY